jgi:hypothetical protein
LLKCNKSGLNIKDILCCISIKRIKVKKIIRVKKENVKTKKAERKVKIKREGLKFPT